MSESISLFTHEAKKGIKTDHFNSQLDYIYIEKGSFAILYYYCI